MHYLLFYEVVPDYLQRREEFRSAHLKRAWEAVERGELVLGGALTGEGGSGAGAVLLFRGDSPQPAERFAASDPYVRGGLVTRWTVRPWVTVVGAEAANPVRAED